MKDMEDSLDLTEERYDWDRSQNRELIIKELI